MSNELATTTGAALPALYGGETDVTANDLIMPRIETVQGSSAIAKNGVADEGDIIFRYGSDDEDPTFLVGGPDKIESSTTLYVLRRQKFAATVANGTIEFHPTPHRDESDPDSWEGWRFYIAVPEVDPFMPAAWMLWRTAGSPAARQINTMIQRQLALGKDEPLAIKASVRVATNKRGNAYMKPVIGPSTPDPDDFKVACDIKARMSSLLSNMRTENDAPDAAPQPSIG